MIQESQASAIRWPEYARPATVPTTADRVPGDGRVEPYDNAPHTYSLMHPQAPEGTSPSDGRGLAMVVIDGLGYPALRYAIQSGAMPHLANLLAEQGYDVQHYFPGLPCTTPACMLGFTMGNNSRIPSYTWYDKASGRTFKAGSTTDFHEGFEAPAAAEGHPGLLTAGSIHSCLASGGSDDAHFSIDKFSRAEAQGGTAGLAKQAGGDFGRIAVRHPGAALQGAGEFLYDATRNFKDSFSGRNGDCEPGEPARKRLGESVERALETGLIGAPATQGVLDDMKAGKPAVFVDLAGYDGTAHGYGPYSDQAMHSLHRIDASVGRIVEQARSDKGRNYEVVIFSDHGQTNCVPFKSRYGQSLTDYVQGLARQTVPDETVKDGTAGSLANLYFTSDKGQLSLSDVEQRYPGMVDKLMSHDGVGLVVGRQNGATVIQGRDGRIEINDGVARRFGQDPLAEYHADDPKVLEQLDTLARMPNSGDLMVLGRYLDDQRVVAFEAAPQPGGHGGLGGGQNEGIFISEPDRQLDLSGVTNTSQMYHMFRGMLPADGQV